MGLEAEMAKDVSYQFECKKDGMQQNQDGSWKVRMNIHPDEMDASFLSDPMGQRYVAVLVPLNEDETPRPKNTEQPEKKKEQKTWAEVSYTQRAGILSSSNDFHAFLKSEYPTQWMNYMKASPNLKSVDIAAIFVRKICDVKSRKEINQSTEAKARFENLHKNFTMWQQYEKGGQVA